MAWGGYLGKQYDPFLGNQASSLFKLPRGLDQDRISSRQTLQQQFDRLRRDLDLSGSMLAMDRFDQQAVDIVAGQRAQAVFDLSREPAAVRERYGSHNWCQQALLARRLGRSRRQLRHDRPEQPRLLGHVGHARRQHSAVWRNLERTAAAAAGVRSLLTTLVADLDERGLLDDVLVIAMGEFGRTPKLGTQGSTDGRDHWPVVMSMTMAGGGLRHGQVIGASERDGGQIKQRPVTPGDLAATIYHHMGVPLDGTYLDRSRPAAILRRTWRADSRADLS